MGRRGNTMNIKKSENTWVFVAVLFTISLLSASLIAMVYSITKPVIAKIKKEELIHSAKLVLPSIPNASISYDKSSGIFTEKDQDREYAYAFITKDSKGYGGDIVILMGINKDCKITGFQIMETKETPGLGSNASNPEFKNQFINKGLDNFNFKVKKDGGDVDAITAATITSRAVTNALHSGLEKAKALNLCSKVEAE